LINDLHSRTKINGLAHIKKTPQQKNSRQRWPKNVMLVSEKPPQH